MATPSAINPLSHLINREINNKLNIKVKLYNCRLEAATSLYKKDLISHYGCVNAIEFSEDGELLVSGGDDRRVLLWKVHSALMGPATYKPYAMKQRHFSNIFCLSFDSRKHRIYSGGNDDQVIVHDAETGVARDVFLHDRPVYGLSVDPNNDFIFCSAGDDGRVLVYDSRADASGDSICIAKYHYPFHAVTYHPTESGLIATANAKEGAALWDIRKPRRPLLRYGEDSSQTCMSIRFNSLGTKLLALRRRLPPVLFSVNRSEPEVTFYHTDYYNSCTMKSCCFAGRQDQFVMSGSDDFNLYMWRIPPNDGPGKDLTQSTTSSSKRVYKTHMVLYGHRSIVNQVRYNQNNCFVASSGVEKMIKLWSPFKMPEWSGGLTEEAAGNENPRNPYTNEDYNLMMQVGGQFNLHHDYSSQSTSEDPTMMAFFDTLIQQDSETWRTGAAGDSTACTSSTSSTSNTDSSSMAHDSTDTEASEARAANCKVKWSKRNRLTVSPLVSRPQRAEYPNRIDFLLAMKRSQLMRLAQKKRAAHCARRQRNRQHGQDTRRRVSRTSRSGIGRQAVREREKNRILNNRPPRRSTRNSSCRYRHRVAADIKKRSRKQLKSSNSTPVMVPANLSEPSTSTGITGTGSKIMFRIAHEADSEDDGSGISCNKSPISPLRIRLVNILPTPINGSRSQCPPIDSPNSEHDQDCPNTSRENDNISTTSQDSRLSPKDDFKDHLSGFTSHLRVQTPDSGILTGPCSSAGSMSSEIVPIQNAIKVNSHNDLVAEPSTSTGISTGAKAFFNVRNFFKREHTDPNSDESSWSDYQTIKRKIKKVRRNYRHHFESDSS